MSLNLKTDWTSRDYYGVTDLNRVGEAIAYIANRMITIAAELAAYREQNIIDWEPEFDVPYDPEDIVVEPKTDWIALDVPRQSQTERLLDDMRLLRRQLPLSPDAPEVPKTMNNLDFNGANDIERLLLIVDNALTEAEASAYDAMTGVVPAFAYAGILYSGE